MAKYWKGDHTTHKLRYHLVWIPKYRKRVLRGKIAAHLKGLLFEACKMNRWWIEELTVQDDHVHMIIQLWPRESVAEVVQKLKGGTSKVIRATHPELEEFLWGDSLWADGYFAETIGSLDEEIVKKYIRDQRQ
jgi:putative transposase